jgi:hypothetical protein
MDRVTARPMSGSRARGSADQAGGESDRGACDDGGDDADAEAPDADEGGGGEGDDEPVGAPGPERRSRLRQSKGIVQRMSVLFALDSFGGGFVIQSFIAYWFTRRFHASPETLAAVFFAIGLLQAGSFQAAIRIAERIGLFEMTGG